jgi:hypothetical protein
MGSIAHQDFLIVGSERHPRTEATQERNSLHHAFRINPVNLTRLAARPSKTSAVECDTLGVIETIRENLKPIDRNLW